MLIIQTVLCTAIFKTYTFWISGKAINRLPPARGIGGFYHVTRPITSSYILAKLRAKRL